MSDKNSNTYGSGIFSTSTTNTLTTDSTTGHLVYDTTNNNMVWNAPSYGNLSTSVDFGYNELCSLPYTINFSVDKDNILKNNLLKIKNKFFIFKCSLDENNHIKPYEYLMNLIENKIKMDITIKVSDILTIKYCGLKFTKIKNNLSFSEECNFDNLKVKIKYDKILHQNDKLSIKQKRTEKLEKILSK